jgi:dolichol kinase|tara:strand:- start:151 stop:726 length:576 start_codon:yes stop_codon:yes gene_type:complete
MNQEIKRQIFHLLGVSIVLLSYVLPKPIALALLFAFFVLASTLCLFRPLSHKLMFLKNLFDYLHNFARAEERRIKIYFGLSTIFFSAFLTMLIFGVEIFRIAILVLAVGDAFSTLIGAHYGHHLLPYHKKKTWEGLFAGVLTAFLACLFLLPWPLALAAAAIGMIIESIPIPFNDNFTVPLAVAIVMWFLL